MATTAINRPVFSDVAYLASCAIREVAPDSNRVMTMDLDLVFQEASRQLLAGCCAFALERVDMCSDDFEQAKIIAIRRAILLDQQRKIILDRLEDEGIWYLPLKGAVLKDYYPSIGMREMSDNDILYDASRTEDMRAIMADLGFRGDDFDDESHDCFFKEPIYNFEMHRTLFRDSLGKKLNPYFSEAINRALPDEGKEFGYHFSPEDFYLYNVAHEYKHYCYTGTGLRSCFDTYILLSRESLNIDYIAREAERMGIASFEQINRQLSMSIVNETSLSSEELDIIEHMHRAGAYGNLETKVLYRVAEEGGGIRGRIRYVISRAFPPIEQIKISYPIFFRHKILLPLLPFVRLGRAATVNRRRILSEIKALNKSWRTN